MRLAARRAALGVALLVLPAAALPAQRPTGDAGEREAWATVAHRGRVDSAELSIAAGCSTNDAARLLEALYRRRLVMQLDDGYAVFGGI